MKESPQPRIVQRRVLREEIREHLIEAILKGEIPFGARIIETHVAQQFSVSQAPVREALRDLEMLGFVVSSPFRGTQVREISNSELAAIYPIRAALEGVAAREAANRIDETGLARLADALEVMREAAARDDARGEVDADIKFHHLIVEASGNRLLRHFWESMRLETTTFLTVALTRRPLHQLAERHGPILAALRAKDPIAAEDAMRHHIEEAGEWVRSMAEKEPAAETATPGHSNSRTRATK
jgi:DNA-binding GntR family transcriptional regulator